MEESNNSGALIGALLIGVAIGGLFGVLLAPNKGSKTRKKIIKKSAKIIDIGKGKFEEFLKELQLEVDSINDETIDYIEIEPQYWRS